MTRILVIDNYDSFVYTIVDYLKQLGAQTIVKRNDAVDPAEVVEYDGVLVSPGPGAPHEAGRSMDAIGACAEHSIPMLGVCLGHQALGEVFGATVSHVPELLHGKTSQINHENSTILDGLPSPLQVTRYHSLAVEPETIPAELDVTATTGLGIVMALEHKTKPLYGLQFHPESVLTQGGHRMLANWLQITGLDTAIEASEGRTPLVRDPRD